MSSDFHTLAFRKNSLPWSRKLRSASKRSSSRVKMLRGIGLALHGNLVLDGVPRNHSCNKSKERGKDVSGETEPRLSVQWPLSRPRSEFRSSARARAQRPGQADGAETVIQMPHVRGPVRKLWRANWAGITNVAVFRIYTVTPRSAGDQLCWSALNAFSIVSSTVPSSAALAY
jgi:hypothetical protein